MRFLVALMVLSMAAPAFGRAPLESEMYDLVVYGGTSGGVVAALQAKKMGKTAIVIEPSRHLGGLTTGGLGWTDTGNKAVIGGLSREFYHRVYLEYAKDETWKWQDRASFGNKGQGHAAMDGAERTMWIFEPSVAERVYNNWVVEADLPIVLDGWLDREKGVHMDGNKITAITLLDGRTFKGRMFIDATYEGDLMAAAGVSYHVGRESNDVYDEKWNGVQKKAYHHGHGFHAVKKPISAYKVPGDPSSGLLARISDRPPGADGQGDDRVQAYCFRMCLTDHPENRIPFAKPEGYDPEQYELMLRIFDAGWRQTFGKFDRIPNGKTDTNNHGPFSFDNIGYNYDYPDASYERRKEIIAEHEQYQKGLLYFIANDPRVPEDVRAKMQKWGLPKDEFTDNGNWSHQLYIREARRMVGAFVMTENELLKRKPTPDSVGMGSYTIDSHNTQRYVDENGNVQNEGDVGVGLSPYQIAYGSLVPQKEECTNLLVPVCVSSSHIAFGSIRMEPVFMILGQSAATAAMMALEEGISVQDVPYEKLREKLLADGQVLEYAGGGGGGHGGQMVDASKLKGIVVDNHDAKSEGKWEHSSAVGKFVNKDYVHDGDANKGDLSLRFVAKIEEAGEYEVRLAYTPNSNRAGNVPVTIETAEGPVTKMVDQRRNPPIDQLWISLGTFPLASGETAITISNQGTQGHVIADAVQILEK
jgi:hypothetical protein